MRLSFGNYNLLLLSRNNVTTKPDNKMTHSFPLSLQSRAIEAYATYRKAQFDLYWKNASVNSYPDPDVKRKLTFLKNIGTAILDTNDLNNMTKTRSDMSAIYNTARICPYDKKDTCDLPTEGLYLDPGIELALSKSENYDEQLYLWVS